nr:ankyrin-3 isoform X21 [Parasteatoda tepidariorum]
MTQFVSHIPVDIAVSRSPRHHYPGYRDHYPPPPHLLQHNHKKTDGNASFLRAARSGNVEKIVEYLKGNIDINTSNANGLNALHLAAKEGHVNVVTELLKRGANVNAATKKGNTALHIASLAGQEEIVKVLIQLGANVNVQSQNGFTPLYMAAQENHDSVVSFLLANGANQSLATEDGFTPLAVALQQGHDKVVAVLLENDTKGRVRLPALHIAAKKDDCKAATLLLQSDHNPDVTSKSGFTPLHIAAHYGNENIAKILLSKGADVNYAAKHQITPLHVASKWGKINMVMLLLEKGANIEAATRDGLTPLHCAARSGHDQVVDLLLEKGAPFLAKTKNGLAPLHMASQGDHVDSARILLYHKAPVDDVTVDYLTALHVAAHCGHVKVAKLLLDRKADPNARALNGFTPLHIACKKNRIKVVELLLKHGASIEATTESGLTPLHVASFMGCMNIVIYLIQNGSNPDVPTVRGETPLHLAARANQTDIIRILLRNGASVDARAREEQTPLHIASRLGNVDIVSLLLQHGAAVDATTKDMYTALHIASKEDQEEVASSLLDHGASLTATTKKGFTPLHLAAKYGNIKVARLLLQKGAAVDAQGKNGVTPLHVASHYDHVNVALLLLEKGASPHAMAKNGYTPLHIAAKKNQMDIASTLLEYGANANAESKAGFTPLHLASQEGHADISSLLIDHKAKVNHKANNGLTPLHLCAQDDKVNVATILVDRGAEIGPQTKAGYTPLHVASHFGQINMVRFLIQNKADIHTTTSHGYTALHQAAQQGHTLVVNHLLENQASPNVTTTQGQTPLSIAQRLGYISVVETLKVVTETTVTTTTTTVTEEKYKVVAPETMQETFMTDSEDEGGADFDEAAIFGKPTHATHVYLPFKEGSYFQMSEEAMLGDQSYRYLTADEMKSLGDDSLPIDVTKDEKHHDVMHSVKQFGAPMVEEDKLSPQHGTPVEGGFSEKFSPDNIDLGRVPVHAGRFSWADDFYSLFPKGMSRSSRLKWKTFLVSFMVDARGGAMRGCRHSGVRVIIPPRKASMPMRITCRYLRKEKLIHPPPLMEGEACASRILEMGPVGARFLGPVIIEVPHFASTRGKEREITILRSDTGESWREHTLEASEEAVQEVLNESFEGEELSALEDLNTNRITRILTTDFPQYFAIVTRVRQEVHGVGPEGGMVSSTVVPQVQAIFPEGALTKKIRVGLQAQPIAPELVAKLLGNRVAVSPIVTVEPRRRKFHKPITLTIPVPQAATKGMINQYSGDAPTLRLLCSITGSTKSGGSSKAQWEDVTGSTPLTFVNDCVSFTTTVSARFWLMDCRQVNEVTRYATELYQEAVYVPFMSKFVIFAKRYEPYEAQLRVFCMTDDKEDKTLECQEHFTEVAKSRDVEVLEGKLQYLEFAGNLAPVTKSGEQLKLDFQAFHENRLPFTIRVKDPHMEPMGRIAFMREPKTARGDPPQTPICNLNVVLPEVASSESSSHAVELVTLEKKYDFMQESGLSKPEVIHRADLRLSDIARELDKDWVPLAQQLELSDSDVSQIKAVEECENSEKALMMLRLWLQKSGSRATGNELEKGLRKINREDIIKNCMFNVELVTDDVEKAVAKVHLDQSGFDVFKEELGSSREASMRRGASLDASVDEQDITKEAESAAETSSETGSLFERDQISQAFTDELMKDHIKTEDLTNLPTSEEINQLFPKCKLTPASQSETTMPHSSDNNTKDPAPAENIQLLPDDESEKRTMSVVDGEPLKKIENGINVDVIEQQNEIRTHEFWPPDKISSTQTIIVTSNPTPIGYSMNEEPIEKVLICSSPDNQKVSRTDTAFPTTADSSKVLNTQTSLADPSVLECAGAESLSSDLGYCSMDKEVALSSKTDNYKSGGDLPMNISTVIETVSTAEISGSSNDKNRIISSSEDNSVSGSKIVEVSDNTLPDSSKVSLEYEQSVQHQLEEHKSEQQPKESVAANSLVEANVTKYSSDNSPDVNVCVEDAKIRRASKTPPPSPADEEYRDNELGKKLKEVAFPTLPVQSEVKEELSEIVGAQDLPIKLTESETWPSLEMDTSQVSISSLPDDEKSEPTTATIPLDVERSAESQTQEDLEDLEEDTLSPTKFKDLCSKKVSPTKSIYEGKVIFPSKLPVTSQLTPEKTLFLQELPLSPVKEVSEIETKETCTSPCSDKLETMKPNQLISTRKGFRTRKRLSPIHDTNKFEPKVPSRVDRGLSPIAVFTAGPSGISKEQNEYFVHTYDAPSMQEPVMTENFCNRGTEMSPNTMFGVRTTKTMPFNGHIINNQNESKPSISMEFLQNYLHDKIETNDTSENVHPNSPLGESNSFDAAFADKLVETLLKVEKSTSPFSDLTLDTGIGTDSTVTADTASSPFMLDVQTPSSSVHLLKESCSTQTLHVEMLSAHTSPIDGPFSLQDSNVSCCATESSLKSDSLDDISKTLGTPSSDYVELSVGRDLTDLQYDVMRSTVKEFLEEHIVEESGSDTGKVDDAEDASICSSHDREGKDDPLVARDNDAINKILVIESFRNVFATEPPFAIVGSVKQKREIDKSKRRKFETFDDKLFTLHDQLLSEESALESSTDSGVDLKETGHSHSISGLSDTASMKAAVFDADEMQSQNIYSAVEEINTETKLPVNERETKFDRKSKDKLVEYEHSLPEQSDFKILSQKECDIKVAEKTNAFERKETKNAIKGEPFKPSSRAHCQPSTLDFIENVEEAVTSATELGTNISPSPDIDVMYAQEVFPISTEVYSAESTDVKFESDKSLSEEIVEQPVMFEKVSYSYGSRTRSDQNQTKMSASFEMEDTDSFSEVSSFGIVRDMPSPADSLILQEIGSDKIFMAEATLIQDNRIPLSLSEQSLISKLEQNRGAEIIEGKLIHLY